MHQKRNAVLLVFLAALLLSLAACGSAPASEPAGPAEAAPAETVRPEESDAPAGGRAQDPAAPPSSPAGKAEIAESFVGRPVDELIDALGSPSGSVYAPSCIGPGEDGNLQYDGFSVNTYRENGQETVSSVLLP